MLKKFIYLISFFFIIAFNSCVIDDYKNMYEAIVEDEYAIINVDMGKVAGAPPVNTYDNNIRTARIYVFTGKTLDKMAFFDIASTPKIVSLRVKQAPSKSVFVIVNEPASMESQLKAIRTIEGLSAVKYKMADIFTKTEACSKWENTWDAKPIPMFGQSLNITNIYNIDHNSVVNIKIPVDRVLACVEIYLACKPEIKNNVYVDANTSLDIINTASTGYIVPSTTYPPPADALIPKLNVAKGPTTKEVLPVVSSQSDWSSQQWCFRFYTPERDAGGIFDVLAFKIKGVRFNSGDKRDYEVSIENTEIRRNTIYKIQCRVIDVLYSDLEITTKIVESPWEDSNMEEWIYETIHEDTL